MVIPAPLAPVDEESARIRALFEAAPLGQLVLDITRRIRSANPAAVRLFGFTDTGLSGRAFGELFDPGSGPVLERVFLTVAGNGAAPPETVQARTANGATFPLELTVLRLRTGRTDGFGAIVRDLRAVPGAPTVAPTAAGGRAPPAYTAAELLMANRLRELV